MGARTMTMEEANRIAQQRIAELEAKAERDSERLDTAGNTISRLTDEVERLKEALRTIRNVSHFDSSCNPRSATSTEIEKQWAALEGE